MPKKEIWRDYVVRKYVHARSAEEAIRLSEALPVVEVNEMKDKPEASNAGVELCPAIGFQMVYPEE